MMKVSLIALIVSLSALFVSPGPSIVSALPGIVLTQLAPYPLLSSRVFSWDASIGAEKYRIRWKPAPFPWPNWINYRPDIEAPTTTMRVWGMVGNRLKFCVIAINSAGESPCSNEVEAQF